ncbi:MAG: phosphatase PAP2 family protein [Rhizobacter sp.]|nr:phosphatase PAP2 family protein [Rhizobacter sp.]
MDLRLRQALGRRLRTLWLAKAVATMLGIGAFLLVYFWLLHNPLYPVTMMPLTALDRWIGFEPQALSLYLSLWFYVSIAPALLRNRHELQSYGLAALAMSLVGFAIFLMWPTAVPKTPIDWSLHPSVSFLKSIDLSANACPSMHVAFAVFTALWLQRMLCEMRAPWPLRAFSGLWCLGIVYSTLATRQHVALDVLGGVVLALVVAVLHMQWLDRRVAPRLQEG